MEGEKFISSGTSYFVLENKRILRNVSIHTFFDSRKCHMNPQLFNDFGSRRDHSIASETWFQFLDLGRCEVGI